MKKEEKSKIDNPFKFYHNRWFPFDNKNHEGKSIYIETMAKDIYNFVKDKVVNPIETTKTVMEDLLQEKDLAKYYAKLIKLAAILGNNPEDTKHIYSVLKIGKEKIVITGMFWQYDKKKQVLKDEFYKRLSIEDSN